jgi:prepilin-type N-terminal cleavage/methylation domain-containing protein
MRYNSRAFSLIELLTVISIIAIVAAISYPVFTKVKLASLESMSKHQMKQIHIATLLYQSVNDGDGNFGDTRVMGLPDVAWPVIKEFDTLRPPLAPHPVTYDVGQVYVTLWASPDVDKLGTSWEKYAREFGDNSVMVIDPFNNDRSLPLLGGNYIIRKIFSVRWHGGLVITKTTGFWADRSFWWTLEKQ